MAHKTWYVLLNPETDQPDTSCGYALQCDGNVMTDSIETLEQAETIRRAVNSHAALLEALSELADDYQNLLCDTADEPGDDGDRPRLQYIRQLVAQAKEQP